jgi:hypothetical protein
MDAIDVLDVVLPDILHQRTASIRLVRSQQQVNMVRHQAVRVDRTRFLARIL